MSHEDKYESYHHLAEFEEQSSDESGDYRIEIQSGGKRWTDVAVIAPHGGKIEPHTSAIARQIAGREFALYLFEGTKSEDNFADLHVTSTKFDEPRCVELVNKARVAVAVHGKKDPTDGVLVGRLHGDLAEEVVGSLTDVGFTAERKTDGRVSGTMKSNICNRTKTGKGVQLEICRSLRERLGNNSDRELERFTCAVRDALSRVYSEAPLN